MNTELLVQVSELYYLQEMNQVEIAKLLGVSRPTVSRLLAEAKREGVVEIKVKNLVSINSELSRQLRERLGLKNALIINGNYGYKDALRHSAEAAASFLLGVMEDGDTLGVAWGDAVNFFCEALPERAYTSSLVAQMAGCLCSGSQNEDGFEIAFRVSEKLQCKYSNIPLPLFLDSGMMYDRMTKEPAIRNAIAKAESADIAVTGIGTISARSLLVETNYISSNEMNEMRKKGAAAQPLAQAIDSEGKIVDWEGKKATAAPIESLRNMRWTIGICAGAYKASAALACIRAGYINTLAADEALARGILELIYTKAAGLRVRPAAVNSIKAPPSGGAFIFRISHFFAQLRWISFTISTMGITLTAKAMAMRYSLSSTLVKPKAFATKGTSQTRVVSTREPRAAQVRVLFM